MRVCRWRVNRALSRSSQFAFKNPACHPQRKVATYNSTAEIHRSFGREALRMTNVRTGFTTAHDGESWTDIRRDSQRCIALCIRACRRIRADIHGRGRRTYHAGWN
jgi:hypothetical protein